MLKVTVLFEAHDPLAQARIAELEAERDAAERDTTPSPLFGAVTDLAKVALTQAMSDPDKFKEFLTLFQNKRKPFNVSTLVSSLASGAVGTPSANAGDAGDADGNADDAGDAGSTPSKTPPGPTGPFSSSLKIAEIWTRLDPKSPSVFVRRPSSWPRPAPIIARVQRVGGDIPVEMGAELYVWSLEANANQAPELANFGGAAKTAAAAAMAADKVLRGAGWILLGDYDYDAFPGENPDENSDESGDEDAIRATRFGSVDVGDSPKPAARVRKPRP